MEEWSNKRTTSLMPSSWYHSRESWILDHKPKEQSREINRVKTFRLVMYGHHSIPDAATMCPLWDHKLWFTTWFSRRSGEMQTAKCKRSCVWTSGSEVKDADNQPLNPTEQKSEPFSSLQDGGDEGHSGIDTPSQWSLWKTSDVILKRDSEPLWSRLEPFPPNRNHRPEPFPL